MSSDMLEVAVKGLTFDPITNVPIVILKDVNGKRLLPIWIGVFEANVNTHYDFDQQLWRVRNADTVSVFIAPQTFQSGGGVGTFSASDVLVIIVYEPKDAK